MGAFRLKMGFGDFEILSQVLNGTVEASHPFYSGNSLDMDVVEDVFLSVSIALAQLKQEKMGKLSAIAVISC